MLLTKLYASLVLMCSKKRARVLLERKQQSTSKNVPPFSPMDLNSRQEDVEASTKLWESLMTKWNPFASSIPPLKTFQPKTRPIEMINWIWNTKSFFSIIFPCVLNDLLLSSFSFSFLKWQTTLVTCSLRTFNHFGMCSSTCSSIFLCVWSPRNSNLDHRVNRCSTLKQLVTGEWLCMDYISSNDELFWYPFSSFLQSSLFSWVFSYVDIFCSKSTTNSSNRNGFCVFSK